MKTHTFIFAAVVVGLTLSLHVTAFAQADPSHHPILGKWKINMEKTIAANRAEMARAGVAPPEGGGRQGGVRSDTFTWVYTLEGQGIRHSIYDSYPLPQPSRSYMATLDGKAYPDPQGPNGLGQTVTWWPLNERTIFREVQTKGVPTERVVYEVSPDGKTLTISTWRPDQPNPNGVNGHMVFDRQADGLGSR